MNVISEMFEKIPDQELREAILEIKESQISGFIKEEGYVRKYAKKTGELTNNFTSTDFFMTQLNLLQQAAFRWVK